MVRIPTNVPDGLRDRGLPRGQGGLPLAGDVGEVGPRVRATATSAKARRLWAVARAARDEAARAAAPNARGGVIWALPWTGGALDPGVQPASPGGASAVLPDGR